MTLRGVVQAIIRTDDIHYTLTVKVVSSESAEGEGLAPGALIDVKPLYTVAMDADAVNLADPPNRHLYELRNAPEGTTISATIQQGSDGSWFFKDYQQ